jgi:ribosome-binding factor A
MKPPSRISRAPSARPLKMGEAVRHALADIFMRGKVHDPVLFKLKITVTEVRMSPDLAHATVFITPFGGGDVKPVLRELKRCAPQLRSAVAQIVKMRHAPELHFQPDESFDYAETIEKALKAPVVAKDLKKGDQDDSE